MPNWCNNVATFTHENKEQIDRLCSATNMNLFGLFFPTPDDLKIEAQIGSEPSDNALKSLYEQNTNKYGCKHWYDWNCAHWGTKWDADSVIVKRVDENTVVISFDSAWAAPFAWYNKMLDIDFTIEAYFMEMGCNFCGEYRNGMVDEYDLESMAPPHILEAFGIEPQVQDDE